MSQENIERIRIAFQGTSTGDFSYLPSLIDESCEFQLPHAKHTGMAVDLLVYWVYTFRGGKVVKMEAFLDRTAALEAVGLSD